MRKLYGFFGLSLIILSFLYWYLPQRLSVIAVFHLCFVIGNILLFDFLSYNFSHWSPLHNTKKTALIAHFLLIGLIVGSMLEIYTHWIGRFWFYPLIRNPFIYVNILFYYGLYAFYLLETFLGTKAVLERYFIKHKRRKKSFAGLKKLYLFMGAFSAIGIGAVSIYVAVHAVFGVTLQQTYTILYAPFTANSSYYLFLLLSIFFWLFFEYLEYEKRETSMTYDLIKGNFLPLIAVFLAAWISSFAYEIFNVPGRGWVYENFPFSTITIMSVPIMVFITWPFHYLPIFALYRVLFKKETTKIW